MQPNCEDYIFREFVPDGAPQLRKLLIEALSTSSDVLAARFEEVEADSKDVVRQQIAVAAIERWRVSTCSVRTCAAHPVKSL